MMGDGCTNRNVSIVTKFRNWTEEGVVLCGRDEWKWVSREGKGIFVT